MVATEKFVYVHQPKTGGTFVMDAIYQLHGGEAHIKFNGWLLFLKALYYWPIRFDTPHGKITYLVYKHSGCNRIPAKYSQLPILSNMRHPLDYYASQYEFAWWKYKFYWHRYYAVPGFRKRYPDFPDLSFPDYLRLMVEAFNHRRFKDFDDPDGIGPYTQAFIEFYFRNPQKVLTEMNDEYLTSGRYRADMFDVDFIHTHDLNRQLYDYFLKLGYPEQDLDFILDKKRVLPGGKGRSKEQKWQKYYTDDLKELMLRKDRFLFQLFPEYLDML